MEALNKKPLKLIINEAKQEYAGIDLKEKKTEEAPVIYNFQASSLSDYDDFDERSWKKGEGYKAPNFPMMTEAMEGWDEGCYLVAAESNTGKSAFMLRLIKDLSTYRPNKLFGIYYTLDDTKHDIIPRVIAADQSIPIGVAAKPSRYESKIKAGEENAALYQSYLDRRKKGLELLKKECDCFKIEDGNTLKSAEDIYEHMKQLIAYVKTIDPDMNIVVGIDAVDDLRFKNKGNMTTTERHSEIAVTIKDWATELHIPIFGTRHLKKLGQNRRPTLDDLKDSNEYVYESSAVFLLHCDMSKNKQASPIFYNKEGVKEKQPVIEIDWAKNKKSSFKGRTYCRFSPEMSQTIECSKDECQRYDSLIYSL